MKMFAAESIRSSNEHPWLSGRVPDGYWDLRENRMLYLDWLGQQLGLVTQDDWYQVGATDFIRNHGGALFWRTYNSSVHLAMEDYQPQCGWLPWRFSKTPRGFWQEAENRRSYMQWLESILEIGRIEDWYQLTKDTFAENGGGGLLCNIYRGSILSALREYRPDCDWKPWFFPKVPHGFWKEAENRRSFMEWLEVTLQIGREEDWYQLTKESFNENGGAGLLKNHYRSSILSAVREYRPDYNWKPWLFSKVPHGFWNELGNRRQYLEWLADHLRFRSLSDWHHLTNRDLSTTGGGGLFCSHYGRSMARLREEVVSLRLCERT